MAEDLYPRRAVDDTPYRTVIHHTVFDYRVQGQPSFALSRAFVGRILLAFLVVLALFLGPLLAFRRRESERWA